MKTVWLLELISEIDFATEWVHNKKRKKGQLSS